MDKNQIETLMFLTEDELLIFMGNELYPNEETPLSYNPNKIIEIAQKWIEENLVHLKEILCKNQYVKSAIKNETLEKSALILHIVELIANLHSSNIALYAISVYFVNFGYKKICNE